MKQHSDTQRKLSDEPTIENYPPLRDWLTKINARCLWQADTQSSLRAVEAWSANGAVFLIVLYEQQRGWSIFTDCDTNDIQLALLDAEKRIGLVGDASMVDEVLSPTFGLPMNPPAMPYLERKFLCEQAHATEVTIANDGVMISQPIDHGKIYWFWSHVGRTWAVGPYQSRLAATQAHKRYLKLDNGPIIRHAWTV